LGTRQAQLPYSFDFAKVGDKVPMIEFLDSLNVRERSKVFAFIEKLVELKNAGLTPKENLSKLLTDGIFEMRVSFENRIARTLFFYKAGRKIIFSHGFVKKTQKTPQAEIQRAMTIRTEAQGA
jgi:phage-related protein